MVYVEAPEIAPGGDAFGPERFVQYPLGADAFVFPGALAYAEDDAPLVEQPDIGMAAVQVRHKGGGGVIIQGVVHPGPEEIVGIVAAGETDDPFEQVGTAQEHDGCVGGAHAAACGERPPVAVIVFVDQGNHFFGDVAVIVFLALGTEKLVAVVVGPALVIYRIYAEQLELTVINIFGQFVDHPEVFIVVAHGVLGGEHQQRPAFVSVDADVHVAPEVVAEMIYVVT